MKTTANSRHLRALTLFLIILLAALPAAPLKAALEWPQEITAPEGTIVVYQPQPERLVGNILSGRAAISIEAVGRDEPVFGAMWFTARIDTDRDTDVAVVHDVNIDKVAWPDSRDADEQRFTAIVEGAMPGAGFEISMERLSSSLETAEIVQRSLEDLNTSPPDIRFREELAVLLLYDGQPQFRDIEGSAYRRVLNTPFAVACKQRGSGCWLSSGVYWYQAEDALGPWAPVAAPPADLGAMIPASDEDTGNAPSAPPAIVVATRPTELIVTDGKPKWVPLPGGELLYVENTESPWLRELATGNMYLLLSGRWYRSRAQDGPWVFVRADDLPASFATIPPASEVGGLRTSVAGTPEAEDAMRDAAIPQTTAIKRSEASLTVEYDGQPKFERIEGTDVAYAINTAAQVLKINGRYYAVDNGVWFMATVPTGPWVVADSVPEDKVAEIPPSAPVYNVTHVHVYDATPEVVYVGYTPGYMWSFPYYGVPVYGTGWYYPPYYGYWYYPRPPTWGFHVGYNPWTGWNFGFSWSNGFLHLGMSWGSGYGGGYRPGGCCGGWYGGGYRGPVVINTGNINIGNTINAGNRNKIANRVGNSARLDRSRNIYNRPENRARNADRAAVSREVGKTRPARNRSNDVFADRSGQVVRREGSTWQTRERGRWNSPGTGSNARPAIPASRPASRPALDTRDLNRAYQSRQRGAARERARPVPRTHGGARRR